MIQPHELSDMRRAADKAPFELQRKFHALLDAYEGQKEHQTAADNAARQLEKAREARETLKKLRPDPVTEDVYEPLSDDAWSEYLEETPENERHAEVLKELQRARAGEAAALTRIETLIEGIESAIDDLEVVKD